MECYRVKIPEDAQLRGRTATGEPAPVYPGEYVVHLLRPRAGPGSPMLLRFLGADGRGRDVHVPVSAGAASPLAELARRHGTRPPPKASAS